MIKIIAWNVNSIRSLITKVDLNEFLKKNNPDIFCMSETKLSCPDLLIQQDLMKKINSYKYRYYNTCTARKGYSGTAIWSKKKAINIHMGISPYYKGADCNFWAIYEGNTNLVGATIQYLSKDLDNGPILFHAVNEYHSNPFIYTMLSVKSAIIAVKKYLKQKKKVKPTSIRNPSFSKLTKKKSFNDKIIKKFFAKKITKKDFYTNTLIRPFILKRRDFFR